MKQSELSRYRVDGGFLVRNEGQSEFANRARALDSRRRTRDEEQDNPEDVLEIHNHVLSQEPEGDRELAKDEEGPDEEGREGEVVARYPADKFHFLKEGNEILLCRGSGETARYESDRHTTFDTRDHRRARPPQTLRELNALNARYYVQKAGRR